MSNPLTSDGMKEFQEIYLKGVPQKLKEMRHLIDQLNRSPSANFLESLHFSIHKMAGSAGTYGFSAVSTLCKEWELKLLPFKNQPSSLLNSSYLEELREFPKQLEELFFQKVVTSR